MPIRLKDDGMDISELKKKSPDIIYVTPSHQFPTGSIAPMKVRQQLIKWAKDNNSYIIEDDYDSEYRFKGQPIPSLQSLDNDGRVIYISTFSKAFLPSMRTAYMVVPKHLLDIFEEFGCWEQTIPFIDQRAMAHFMNEGYFEKHHRRMRKLYREKHEFIIKAFHRVFKNKIKIITQETGLRILLEFNSVFNEKDFIIAAKNAGYAVRGTELCWFSKKPEGSTIRLFFGYGILKKSEIDKTITDLFSCWKRLI